MNTAAISRRDLLQATGTVAAIVLLWGLIERVAPALIAADDAIPTTSVAVFAEHEFNQGQSETIRFTAPAVPEGCDAVLVLKARLDTQKVAGHTPALKLVLNGTPLEVAHCGRLVRRDRPEGNMPQDILGGYHR